MKLKGDPALAGRDVRLTTINAALDNWQTPATYVLKADAHGDLEGKHQPRPGPYEVAVRINGGWASPSKVLADLGKGLDQYVVGGWPNKT